MNSKRFKLILAVIICCFCAWLVSFFSRNDGQVERNDTNKLVKEEPDHVVQSEANAAARDRVPDDEAAALAAEHYRVQKAKSNRDIVFYGKVVDQFDSGIEGCKVVVQLSGYESPNILTGSDSFEITKDFETDKNGRFTVDGVNGEALRILKIVKDSYILEQGGRFSFGYGTWMGGRHISDYSSPVVYQMAKAESNIELLTINERLDVEANNNQQEITLPLQFGFSHEPLTLQFAFDRTAAASGNGYDWSYAVRLVDGFIQEAENMTLLLAPDNGYGNSIEQKYTTGSPDWTMRSQKLLYLRHGNGLSHAGIKLTVFSYKDGRSRIIIKGNLNPSGQLIVKAR